jgi:hypothetical protein
MPNIALGEVQVCYNLSEGYLCKVIAMMEPNTMFTFPIGNRATHYLEGVRKCFVEKIIFEWILQSRKELAR